MHEQNGSYQKRTYQSIYSRYLEHFMIYEIRLLIYFLLYLVHLFYVAS